MADVLELKKTVKQLQNASNEKELLDILSLLKGETNVTEAILRESKVGLAVGKLRTHKSLPVASAAKEIVKQWKTAVEKAKGPGAKSSAAPSPVPSGTSAAPAGKNGGGTTPTISTGVRSSKSDGIKGGTGDNTRDKCVELLYDALAFDATAPIEHVLDKARAVEKAVMSNIGSTNAEYKARIRSLFVNLRDKNNPGLRAGIVDGGLTPEKFAKFTSQDMASEERRAADRKIEEENLFKSLAAGGQEAETDAFQCSRCKQRKCVYRQAQTRSADEPMTTFVTCVNCGNKWKFS